MKLGWTEEVEDCSEQRAFANKKDLWPLASKWWSNLKRRLAPDWQQGKKRRWFLHHDRLTESINEAHNASEMYSGKHISGNFRLHTEQERIEEGEGKKIEIHRCLVWWTVIHTYFWTTGACIAIVIFWEPELCPKMENKGARRTDTQQQKRRAKHRKEIPSLWPRGKMHQSLLQNCLWTARANSNGASDLETTFAFLFSLLTRLTVFSSVSHVEYTSGLGIWVCLLTFWIFFFCDCCFNYSASKEITGRHNMLLQK